MVLIYKAEKRQILEYLFDEGVIVVKKDNKLASHSQALPVHNLKVMMMLKSLKSRFFVEEKFAWQYHYYTLNDEGIEYIRNLLRLNPDRRPATLPKPTAEIKA